MFRNFFGDRRGNFAAISAIATLPLVLAVGVGVDGSRYYKARSHLQQAVDMAALAVAASPEQDVQKLRSQAEAFILNNIDLRTIENIQLSSFEATTDDVRLGITGSLPTTFMQLANFDRMNVQTKTAAKRSPERVIEVALVLDNTYSMKIPDPASGEPRIDTLRKASKSLVEALIPVSKEGTVSIALVPYADHVNVGADNRSATWLALNGAERTETGGGDRFCSPKVKSEDKKKVCKKYASETCSRVRDGVYETYACNGDCTEWAEEYTYSQTCTGSDPWTKTYQFHGCVGTRVKGSLRLSDASPADKYPAYVEQKPTCARPIIELTKAVPPLLAGVASMTYQTGDYVAYTHIASGVVWGLNVLSPTAPFESAMAYDDENVMPRKIMILMTDGDNTLIHDSGTGKHVGFKTSTADAQFKAVNADTLAICNNAKKQKIEIYSIAFAVTKQEAKDLLRGCATDSAHYYDANDAAKLTTAFSGIARSINQVRLAE